MLLLLTSASTILNAAEEANSLVAGFGLAAISAGAGLAADTGALAFSATLAFLVTCFFEGYGFFSSIFGNSFLATSAGFEEGATSEVSL